jgi:hemolysin activation/secretion protein
MEMIEDRIVTSRNLNQMGRPEFLPMGLQTVLQIGYASQAFGSTRDALRYAASVSRGFEPGPNQTMLASAKLEGRYADGAIERQRLGGQLQYFLPQGRRWLFYAGLSGDMLTHPGPLDMLTLGGDNGLRGYPLRYQTGTQRALLTLEERFYSDLYVFRLFRVGGAGFIDVGRAWGGPNAGPESERWLADAGFGLRIFSVRAAFSNVLHVDLAFPLYGDSNLKTVQFLVRTRASF